MSKSKRPEFSTYVSPVGIASATWVIEASQPFQGEGKPQFKTTIGIEDTAEARAWCEKIVAQAEVEAKANDIKLKKQYHIPFIMPEDVDEDDFIVKDGKKYARYPEEYRGRIIFTSKSGFKPGLIDTNRESLPDGVKIYSGDEIRIKFEAAPYSSGINTGVTLYLKTVQLVDKKTGFGEHAPDTDGFDDIDGYTAPNEDF